MNEREGKERRGERGENKGKEEGRGEENMRGRKKVKSK